MCNQFYSTNVQGKYQRVALVIDASCPWYRHICCWIQHSQSFEFCCSLSHSAWQFIYLFFIILSLYNIHFIWNFNETKSVVALCSAFGSLKFWGYFSTLLLMKTIKCGDFYFEKKNVSIWFWPNCAYLFLIWELSCSSSDFVVVVVIITIII